MKCPNCGNRRSVSRGRYIPVHQTRTEIEYRRCHICDVSFRVRKTVLNIVTPRKKPGSDNK